MKKKFVILLFSGFILALSGCGAGDIIDRLTSQEASQTEEPEPDKDRVYMDEIRGILTDFTGSQLTITKDSAAYNFDVSQATLECKNGMIAGDEISVIYEGQLENTDTSTVRVLKVVSTDPDSGAPEEKTTCGELISLTAHTIAIKTEEGQTITFPTIGAEQYYQNGLKKGVQVYLHSVGDLTSGGSANTLSGAHVKTVSVSDIDPLTVPDPTPTPTPAPEGEETSETKQEEHFRGVIQNIQLNTLEISVENTETQLKLDISGVPCHFSGGTAPGSHVNVIYTGAFNGTTTEGITLLGVTGETPENLREREISFTVSGEITGSTANTITILTSDNLLVTCYTTDAADSSTGGLLTGSSVKITFNPASSRESNIYTAIKIEDA